MSHQIETAISKSVFVYYFSLLLVPLRLGTRYGVFTDARIAIKCPKKPLTVGVMGLGTQHEISNGILLNALVVARRCDRRQSAMTGPCEE